MKIDCHIHLFCLSSQSGGRTRLGFFRDLARPIIARALRVNHVKGNIEREQCYIDRLADQVACSELDRAVLLSFDAVYDRNGALDEFRSRFVVPNEYTIQAVQSHPDRFLFGASIHPFRQDAIEALHQVKESGAQLIKLLPNTHHFDPADPIVKPYYRTAAKLKLPLLMHGGFEHTIPVYNQQYGNPTGFRLALEQGATVIIAHGGSAGRFHRKETFGAALRLMADYPHCFGDTSALCNYWRSHYLLALKNPELLKNKYGIHMETPFDHFIHGSDFPIPITPRFLGFNMKKIENADSRVKDNRLQADIALKRLLHVPDACLTRAHDAIGIGRISPLKF